VIASLDEPVITMMLSTVPDAGAPSMVRQDEPGALCQLRLIFNTDPDHEFSAQEGRFL
jgi:hypothetical protein